MLHHLSPRFHDFSNAFKWKLEGKKKNILKKKNQLIRDYKIIILKSSKNS